MHISCRGEDYENSVRLCDAAFTQGQKISVLTETQAFTAFGARSCQQQTWPCLE